MATFKVDIGNATYEVDAADENSAWKLANQVHLQPALQQPKPAIAYLNELKQSFDRPSTGSAGTLMGLKDPPNAGAQYVSRLVPPAVNEALDVIPAQLRASQNPIVSKLANTLLANPRPEAIDQAIREQERQYQTQRAQTGESGFDPSRMAGNVAPTIAMGLGSLPAAAVSTIPRMLASTAGLGAVSSQLTPAISKEEQANFPQTKQSQAAVGMMLGPAGTIIGRGLVAGASNIAQRFSESSAADAAKLKLAELLSKSGVGEYFTSGGGNPLAQIEAKLATRGPESTLAGAAGDYAKGKLDLLATLPGQAKTLVEQFIHNQQATRGKRLVTAADEALGTSGKTYTGTLADLIAEKKTIAGPLYKQLEGLSVRVDDDLASLIQASKTAHGGAELLAELKRTTPIDVSKIKVGDDIPFDTLDKVKQALYDLAEKSKGEFGKPTTLSGAYNDLRISLTNKMDALSPKDKNGSIYKQARDAFAGPSQIEDAVKAGRDSMKQDAIKVADATKGMTQGEIESYRIGVLQSLKDKVGTEGGQTSLLKMWKEPATSDKLKEIFGNDYRKFAADVAREARLKEIESVGRGSQTASRLAQMEEDSLGNIVQAGQAATSAVHGNPLPAISTTAKLLNRASTPETTRNELAKLLLQQGPLATRTIQQLPAQIKAYNEKLAQQAAIANALAQQPQR
jgi:hypothetical protein